MITLYFPFAPVPKGRPRFSRNGHAYTPDKTRRYEADLKLWALKQMHELKPLEGPISVRAVFIIAKPKSAKRREHPVVKPDLDNYLKTLDALNGIVWKDDSQIVEISGQKIYAFDDAGPRTAIVVKELK